VKSETYTILQYVFSLWSVIVTEHWYWILLKETNYIQYLRNLKNYLHYNCPFCDLSSDFHTSYTLVSFCLSGLEVVLVQFCQTKLVALHLKIKSRAQQTTLNPNIIKVKKLLANVSLFLVNINTVINSEYRFHNCILTRTSTITYTVLIISKSKITFYFYRFFTLLS
jgi:hypothetical protein